MAATFVLSAAALLVAVAPVLAATAQRNFSVSVAGGRADGYVRFNSVDDTKYTVVYTVRDTSADGVCVRLQQQARGFLSLPISTSYVGSAVCGNGTVYGPYGTNYDIWGERVTSVRVRICTWHNGQATTCGSWDTMYTPFAASS